MKDIKITTEKQFIDSINILIETAFEEHEKQWKFLRDNSDHESYEWNHFRSAALKATENFRDVLKTGLYFFSKMKGQDVLAKSSEVKDGEDEADTPQEKKLKIEENQYFNRPPKWDRRKQDYK